MEIAVLIGVVYFLFFGGREVLDPNGTGSPVKSVDGTTVITPTITNAKAKSISLQLKEELGKFITSDSIILGLFSGLNEADFNMISKAFGTMTRDVLTQSEGGFLGTERDLIWWLVDELDASSLKTLKQQFPLIM